MIELLVGHIASGKSTWAKKRAMEGAVIINDDSIVNAVHANHYGLYREDLKPLYKGVEQTIFQLAVAMGKDVVVDGGLSVSEGARKRWIALAKAMDVSIKAVVFPVHAPEDHAKRRFLSDGRNHSYERWLEVAQQHASIYKTPSLDEGFDEIVATKWRDGSVFAL